MYVNQGDFQLLVVKNQIDTLIFDPFLSHILCFKYSNGPYEPILDIYVLRAFQWYKEVFNPMSFDLWNHSLKNGKSIRTPTLKIRVHLEMCGLNSSHTF